MQRMVALCAMACGLLLLVGSCSPPKPAAQEEAALSTMQDIQRNIETDISYDRFLDLLQAAKPVLDGLKHVENANTCFQQAIERSFASYAIAGKAWKKKMEAEDEARRTDMALTLNFSLSFATVSIQQASDCFKKK
jgi:hypothetical protein